jgi:ATP-dependent protease ClpP protease subunit
MWDGLTEEQLLNARRIAIRGTIDLVSSARAFMKLKYLDSQEVGRPIRVLVDSRGGGRDEALTICDAMREARSPVATHCCGFVGGMAVLVAAAGTIGYRTADPACSWQVAWTWSDNPEATPAMLAKSSSELATNLASRTTRPADGWLDGMARRETFSADQALAWGVIDRICATPDPDEPSAAGLL